jgi:AICAR transformylase/IMP cyclohydrolase PurH
MYEKAKIAYLSQDGQQLSFAGYNTAGTWPTLEEAEKVLHNIKDITGIPVLSQDVSGCWLIMIVYMK